MGSTSVFYTTELGNDLQVQIISYNGDIGIDIRKWCLSSNLKFIFQDPQDYNIFIFVSSTWKMVERNRVKLVFV